MQKSIDSQKNLEWKNVGIDTYNKDEVNNNKE